MDRFINPIQPATPRPGSTSDKREQREEKSFTKELEKQSVQSPGIVAQSSIADLGVFFRGDFADYGPAFISQSVYREVAGIYEDQWQSFHRAEATESKKNILA